MTETMQETAQEKTQAALGQLYYTVRDAAKRSGFTPNWILKNIYTGSLGATKNLVTGEWEVPVVAYAAWLAGREVSPRVRRRTRARVKQQARANAAVTKVVLYYADGTVVNLDAGKVKA